MRLPWNPVRRLLRSTGADLPFGDLRGAHPGVDLESCFWRIVDARRGEVVLAIATVCRDDGGRPWASVALARGGGGTGPRVAERVVEEVEAAEDRLDLRAGDVLHAREDGLRVDLGPGARLDVRFEDGFAWPRGRHGGLGLAHLVPGLTQYWHPHLLGARVRGGDLDGALAYGEKNWGGGGAPRAWWWGQAFVRDDVCVAFAGGTLDAGPLSAGATAVAARVGTDLVALAPPLAVVRMRAGNGRWELDARSAGHTVRVRATAEGRPLDLPVPVPGERRTLPLSHQHQDGELELEVRRGRRILVRGTASLAGLERGGAEGTGAAAS